MIRILAHSQDLRRTLYLLFMISATSLCLPFSGCLEERYAYPNIKAEYELKAPLPDLQPPRPSAAMKELLTRPISLGDAVKIALQGNPDIDMAIA
ncbi:MAG: hypothetical protein V1689_00110, partial [Pseudomonadota bacterium]